MALFFLLFKTVAIAISINPKITSVDSIFIAKLCKGLVACRVSIAGVNERHGQDFVGRIGPHILSISPGSVTTNQYVLCITSHALAHQFQYDREI